MGLEKQKDYALCLYEHVVGIPHTGRSFMVPIDGGLSYAVREAAVKAREEQTAVTYRWRIEVLWLEHDEERDPCCMWRIDSRLTDRAMQMFRRKYREVHGEAASVN